LIFRDEPLSFIHHKRRCLSSDSIRANQFIWVGMLLKFLFNPVKWLLSLRFDLRLVARANFFAFFFRKNVSVFSNDFWRIIEYFLVKVQILIFLIFEIFKQGAWRPLIEPQCFFLLLLYVHHLFLLFLFIRIVSSCPFVVFFIFFRKAFKFFIFKGLVTILFLKTFSLDFLRLSDFLLSKHVFKFSIFLSPASRDPNVFVSILKESFYQNCIFFLVLLVNTRLILFPHTCNYIGYVLPMILHFLVVAAALTRISSDDHVSHHFVYSGVFDFLFIFK